MVLGVRGAQTVESKFMAAAVRYTCAWALRVLMVGHEAKTWGNGFQTGRPELSIKTRQDLRTEIFGNKID